MESLPNEIINTIFLLLDPRDAGHLFQVNKWLWDFSRNQQIITSIQKSRYEKHVAYMLYLFSKLEINNVTEQSEIYSIQWDDVPILYNKQEAIVLNYVMPYTHYRESIHNVKHHTFYEDIVRNIHIFGEEVQITLSFGDLIVYQGSSKKFPPNLFQPFAPTRGLVPFGIIIITSDRPIDIVYDAGFFRKDLRDLFAKSPQSIEYCCRNLECKNPRCIKRLLYRKKKSNVEFKRYRFPPNQICRTDFESFKKRMDCFYDTEIVPNSLIVEHGGVRLRD